MADTDKTARHNSKITEMRNQRWENLRDFLRNRVNESKIVDCFFFKMSLLLAKAFGEVKK